MLPGGAHLCRTALPIALVMSESSRGFPMNEAREWRVHKCINCADNRVYKLFSMSNTSLINKQVICLVAGVKIDPNRPTIDPKSRLIRAIPLLWVSNTSSSSGAVQKPREQTNKTAFAFANSLKLNFVLRLHLCISAIAAIILFTIYETKSM